MKINYLLIIQLLIFTSTISLNAQSEIIQVWKNGIPGAKETDDYTEKEVFKDGELVSTSQVSVPSLYVYTPTETKANGTAMLILPGGGYSHLSMHKEGKKVARWLTSLGITSFVLKYRLPSDLIMKDKTIGPLQDAQQAMRIIRGNAARWKINPHKIGVIGFSAGGHLAATLSTHFNESTYPIKDTVSCRPDFSLLIYPVISMKDEVTHKGSQRNLLGDNPSENQINKFSNELCVTPQSPPAFIIHAADDKSVHAVNSVLYYNALRKNNIPAELHIYETGGHGFSLGVENTSVHWPGACINWLALHSYISVENK